MRGYSRWAAGARREMSTLVLFGLAVAVIGNAPNSNTGGKSELPRPSSTVYPVKFPGWNKTPVPRPRPTVSYPIPWDRSSR
ncbi:hypothetical protein ACFU8W_50465 [Streptomyces sp. NPDC057565]|uniref:hypothetical protein n=1 Tax=Streptomyces sp. NPDC057565 TaxID=3346169 RepID=UPI0036CF1A6E